MSDNKYDLGFQPSKSDWACKYFIGKGVNLTLGLELSLVSK